MELRQLEYLIAVAEEANFTRAAERVHVSQSGISAQIRQLEAHLGATLIDRSTRTAGLTTAGAAALDHARAALASVQAMRQAVDDVNGLMRGRLVIGMVTACTVTPLFDILAAFHRAHSGVEITLVEDTSDRLVDAVGKGALDLALIGTAGAPPRGFEALLVVAEPIVAAVPPEHALAHRSRATLRDLVAHSIICMPPGTCVRAVFDRGCVAQGVKPNIALQASAPGAIADLAVCGLGVAILTESMAAGHADQLTAIALDGLTTSATLALIWTDTESPALRELVRYSRQALRGS